MALPLINPQSIIDRPKRPPNAYMLFCIEARQKILDDDPTLDHKQIMVKLGEKWNELTEEERLPYRKNARELLDNFKLTNPVYKYKKHKQREEKQALPPRINYLWVVGNPPNVGSTNPQMMYPLVQRYSPQELPLRIPQPKPIPQPIIRQFDFPGPQRLAQNQLPNMPPPPDLRYFAKIASTS